MKVGPPENYQTVNLPIENTETSQLNPPRMD